MEGRIQPGRVFDRVIRLDDVPDGYRAVDERQAIKVMVKPWGDLALAVAPHSKPLPSRTSGGSVTFEPGARSAWHTHPLGQILLWRRAPAGCSERAVKSKRSNPAMSYGQPGVKHWHSATAATAMNYIAIQEEVAGNNVDWLEQV
jgi:quercetin dioxygenase-like cupin family protein